VFGFSRRGGAWRLCAAAFALGLGISNHLLMVLVTAAFGVYAIVLAVQGRVRAPQILLLILCGIAGSSVFLYAFLRDASAYGVPGVLKRMIAPEFGSKMFPAGLTPKRRLFWILNYVLLLLWNFPSAAAVFACLGFKGMLSALRDKSAAVFYMMALSTLAVWSANYLIWDMYAFSLPVYVMLAVPMAFGIDAFLRRGVAKGRWAVFLTFLLPLVLYPTFSRWPLREKTIDVYISMYPESVRLGGYWDPAEYIFNPIKRDYRAVQDYAEKWAEALPQGACFWDDESKAAQPLLFYYQGVRGVRRDVDIHFFYSLAMDETDARNCARDIQLHLSRGQPAFISSLAVPEREIMNQLYSLESPDSPLSAIRSMSEAELMASFPRIRVTEVPLGRGLPSIFRLEP